MNKKVTIPENIADITIDQFQRLNAINQKWGDDLSEDDSKLMDDEILHLFTGLKSYQISKKDRDSILNSIGKSLTTKYPFKQRFKFKGVEYGMIPNFDKITASEYTDLIKYADDVDSLHRLMAVAFRPITKKSLLKDYSIEEYTGTEKRADLFLDLTMNIVSGFNGFFLTLLNDLEVYIQKSILEELQRETAQ